MLQSRRCLAERAVAVVGFICDDVVSCDLVRRGMRCGDASCDYIGKQRTMGGGRRGQWRLTAAVGLMSIRHLRQHSSLVLCQILTVVGSSHFRRDGVIQTAYLRNYFRYQYMG